MAKIYITEISDEAYIEFSRAIDNLKANSKITLEITSSGGDVYAALAFYDKIRTSKHKFTGVVFGWAASAGTLVFLGCHHRIMAPSSWLMFHEDTPSDTDNKPVGEVERIAKHSRRLENQWNDLLSKVTKLTSEEWQKLHAAETYLTAQECLNLKIIEEIL